MKPHISFQELARIQAEQLAKQPPVTIEQAREQVQRVMGRLKWPDKKQIVKDDLKQAN